MKAYALHGVNDLRYEEVDIPEVKDNEVLVNVQAAGVCGSDIPRIYKTGTYSFPLIPGHEFSGVVEMVGQQVDDKWSGKRVGVFPLIPCRKCIPCKSKRFEMCRHYSYLGSRSDGGFAEYVAVPVWNLIELPESVSFEQAAMREPMAVAVHAMREADVQSDQTVAVIGLGTIGLLLCMFLVQAGVKNILVIGNKEFQKQQILALGISADHYCDSRTQKIEEWLAKQTNAYGVNVFFECVGKTETINQAILNTAPGGVVQLIGNPASDILFEKNIYWKILRNQLTVKGSWNSSFTHDSGDDWHYVLNALQEGKIAPERFITKKLAFDQLEQGLVVMRDKTEEYVKIMIYRTDYSYVIDNKISI